MSANQEGHTKPQLGSWGQLFYIPVSKRERLARAVLQRDSASIRALLTNQPLERQFAPVPQSTQDQFIRFIENQQPLEQSELDGLALVQHPLKLALLLASNPTQAATEHTSLDVIQAFADHLEQYAELRRITEEELAEEFKVFFATHRIDESVRLIIKRALTNPEAMEFNFVGPLRPSFSYALPG